MDPLRVKNDGPKKIHVPRGTEKQSTFRICSLRVDVVARCWYVALSLRSFLDQEVDVVDAQRSQLLVRALEVKQESTK